MKSQKTISKYLDALYDWKDMSDEGTAIDLKGILKQRQISHALPSAAIEGGYFTKIDTKHYKCNADNFTQSDVRKIIDIIRVSNTNSKMRNKVPQSTPLLTPIELAGHYSVEELAEALKIKGCSAVIEMKQTISF